MYINIILYLKNQKNFKNGFCGMRHIHVDIHTRKHAREHIHIYTNISLALRKKGTHHWKKFRDMAI